MDPVAAQVRDLVDSLSPRTAHQYKSYNDRYIQWLAGKKIVAAAVPYSELPLSAHLVHWFLLDTLMQDTAGASASAGQSADDEDFKTATLKKTISSLKFLSRLCAIHGNPCRVDEKYLENVIKLHSRWTSLKSEDLVPLLKVSINLWNDSTPSLSEKFFKTGLEKTRFLVDFHVRTVTNLSYAQRSKIKLSQLKLGADNSIALDLKTWSSLQVYMPDSKPQIKSHMPIALLPRACAFICPPTSLATYLYLRFYGIKAVTRGDGFPNLLDDAGSPPKDSWLDLPLIRGKSLLDYPRDETLSNYYSSVFRYCQLPYKRRDFFNKHLLEFPNWTDQDFTEFFHDYPQTVNSAFPDHVPIDFKKIMNFKSVHKSSSNDRTVPKSLLVQVFPEIESYRRQWDALSPESKDFIKLMEALRTRLLLNLPIIFKFFPGHDLFKDPIFQNTDFQSYFHDIIGKIGLQDEPLDTVPGFASIDEDKLNNLLIEPATFAKNNAKPDTLVTIDSAPNTNDLMNKTFQFAQYQTLTNFQILISLLSNVFDKLDMKKSSREFMIHQLNLVHDTINEKINVSKPSDVDDFVKKEEETLSKDRNKRITAGKSNSNSKSQGLLAVEDDSSDDEVDEDEQDMHEELKFMINELVGERVRSTVAQQMEQWEARIKKMVDEAVESKISAVMKRSLNNEDDDNDDDNDNDENDENDSLLKRQRLSMTPSITKNESTPNPIDVQEKDKIFEMNPHLDTVESVILEWFTPNPNMNRECVHSMNKTHGKSWRSSFEKLYKERKIIVEFYIHLVNEKSFDRYKSVEICESLKRKTNENELRSLAQYLKDWKKNHSNSFTGILEEY